MEIITLFKVLFGLALVEVAAPDGTQLDNFAKDAVEVAALATIGGGFGHAIGADIAVGSLTALETGALFGATAGVAKVAFDGPR